MEEGMLRNILTAEAYMLSLFIEIPTPEVFMLVIGKYVGKVECVKGNIKNIQSKTFNSWEKFGICFRLDMEVADSTLRWIKSKYKHVPAKLSRIILQD